MSGYKNIIFSIEKKSKSPKKVEEKFFKIDIDYKHEEDANELNNGNSINEKNKNNKLEDNQTKKIKIHIIITIIIALQMNLQL